MLTKYAFDVLTHGFGAQRRHTGWGVTRETSSMDTHDHLVHAHEIARGEWADGRRTRGRSPDVQRASANG